MVVAATTTITDASFNSKYIKLQWAHDYSFELVCGFKRCLWFLFWNKKECDDDDGDDKKYTHANDNNTVQRTQNHSTHNLWKCVLVEQMQKVRLSALHFERMLMLCDVLFQAEKKDEVEKEEE